MRILFMADVDRNPNAGAAGTEVRTIEALRRHGHEVDEIWAGDLRRRIAHGNLHYLLELPHEYRRALARALARRTYDIVHVNQPHGWRAAKWLRDRGRDRPLFVHRSHGLEPLVEEVVRHWRRKYADHPRSMLRRAASAAIAPLLARHNRLIAKYADGHIVYSTLDAHFLVERFQVPQARVAVVPAAAPDELLATAAPTMTAERLQRVLYVGQYAFVKAPMIVAEAVRRLQGERDVTWVCARQHHDEVRALAGDSVRLEGWTSVEALRELYDTHGVFLFPSFFEGFGKVVLEAMSRGMCVIATDIGGAHDVITHGRDGILVAPGDAGAVAAAVRALDLPNAQPMSDAAARTARQYTWDRVGRETEAFYGRLLNMQR